MIGRKNKTKVFEDLYIGLETVKGKKHGAITVLYSSRGEYSAIFEITNPIQEYCCDANVYYTFNNTFANILLTLGEGYTLQKQDIFSKQKFHKEITPDMEFLSRSYFKFFEGREYTDIKTYLTITQEKPKGRFNIYNDKLWDEFNTKINKIRDILNEKRIKNRMLGKKEINELVHRYWAADFRKGNFSMDNFKCSDEYLRVGNKIIKNYSLVDIDEINMPKYIRPFADKMVGDDSIPTDLLNFLTTVPHAECVIYSQVIQIPKQGMEKRKLIQKEKRHNSMPDNANKFAQQDINAALDVLATENKLLVYTHYNIMVVSDAAHSNLVGNYIETKLFDIGITNSKRAYNQLEIFLANFPGNSYALKEYDLFLTMQDAALCLMFKEFIKQDEVTPLKVYYTNRHGLPVAIDITGKEGKVRLTDNSNFFCLGPSGSGKSFHMNSVVRQLIEQGTDVVMVDTGDSYEGICGYFHGTYISYTKEKPISMNPFKITELEYEDGFKEKKNFLKSLIVLIWLGQKQEMTKVEESIIDMVLEEYYDQYFHPFEGFTDEQRKNIRDELLLEAKASGEFDEFEDDYYEKEKEERKYKQEDHEEDKEDEEEPYESPEEKEAEIQKIQKIQRKVDKLHAVITDKASTPGEKDAANKAIMRLTPQLIEGRYLIKIERKIDQMEDRKKKLKVKSLSFNTFYEYALQRIPFICRENKINFDVKEFKFVLKKFYKGGELDMTLNNDVDASLFDERFIVFEIDKIKDDPILFPIVTLIIMDVFLQKMRLKKGRKALIIEEAWKAIASPTMAEYIKYLYKTVRKFKGIAGVVTQELNDVISSPIVKEAIINNSDVKILLDQGKFKDRYEDIAQILGLTEVQRNKIFTINVMDNHENRNIFKEVWVCRGLESDVYGVEEPPQCYMAYTTERDEKEALKIYKAYYNNDTEKAIDAYCKDMQETGLKYLEFARIVNKQKTIMSAWES